MSQRDPFEHLTRKFPMLAVTEHEFTSAETTDYNCMAWAVGEQDRWISPDLYDEEEGLYPWPAGVPRENSVHAWCLALESFGFREVESGLFEEGIEKIAVYFNYTTEEIHFARQLSATLWTSKVGRWEDISHELHALTGAAYGEVVRFMGREVSRVRSGDPASGT